MVKRIIKYCFLAFSLMFIAECAYSETKVLTYGFIEFPPFTYTDTNKKPSGFLLEWAARIMDEAGYKYNFRSFPTVRLAEYIIGGKIDVWIGLKTLPQFEGTVHKGNVKVTDLILRSYTIKGTKNIMNKEDLSGESVIVLRGYSYGGWINYIENPANKVRSINTNKHDYALKMLEAGRAKYLLDYKAPIELAQRKVKVEGIRFNTIKALPIYIVVTKKKTDGERILNDLEKAFLKLSKEKKLTY